jgi:hypothetical protein
MSSSDDGTWYELRPNGQPIIGSGTPRRYGEQAAAEQAAREMRQRYPDFRFVEIISYEDCAGERSRATPVARV